MRRFASASELSTQFHHTLYPQRTSYSYSGRREGKVVLLVALLLPVFLAMVAFAIDIGALFLVRTELQRNADSAALGAVLELEPDAQPAFPLISPVEIQVGIPKVLSAALGRDFQSSLNVVGSEIPLIEYSTERNYDKVYEVAESLAEQHPTMGLKAFQQRREDIEVFHMKSSVDAPNLLPLPKSLQNLGGELESLLLRAPDDSQPNAVRIRSRRDNVANGPVPLFFAPIIGTENSSIQADATAAIMKGYGVRPGAKLLPLAMDITVWRSLRLGNGVVNGVPIAKQLLGAGTRPVILVDEQAWDRKTHSVSEMSDHIWEVLLLNEPLDEVELPGLDGYLQRLLGIPLLGGESIKKTPATIVTLNLSGEKENPSRDDVVRQIHQGVNASDIGEKLYLPFKRYGEESVSPEIFDDLREIIGKPRIIPLFETLTGTVVNKVKGLLGRKKQYRIIGFGGVVITEVKDLGVVKYVKFQPAPIMSHHVLKATSDQVESFSDLVYTGPVLIK